MHSRWAVLGFLCACAGAPPRQVSCEHGRTAVDGICVDNGVADYVACVRAQHVRPDQDPSSADPVSLEVIRTCRSLQANASPPSAEVAEGSDQGAIAAARGLSAPNAGAVRVTLYVMSKCPYGIQAENTFKDVVNRLGPDIDFHIEYIGKSSPNGELTSLHGPTEVLGDLYQVCAQKYSPKWFDTILCQNRDAKRMDSSWEACGHEVGIPQDTIAKVAACAQAQEGKDLLSASFARSEDRGARGSPTLYIGDVEYQGSRRVADFTRGICNAFTSGKPLACKDIPESPKVNVVLLADKRCSDCDTKRLETSLRQRVGNPVFRTLDYGDTEGKKVFDATKPTHLPAVVFDSTLDADQDAAASFGQSGKTAGEYRVITAGDWNPLCADKGGCNLTECKSNLVCRDEKPNKLEVFIMSHCPFGIKGMDAMEEVLDNFKKNKVNIDFSVHYIGDGDAKTSFSSMHGPGEVADDLREVCAIDKYGKNLKFMDFIWCRNKGIRGDSTKFSDVDKALADDGWETCTGASTGFDTNALKKCAQGDEGKRLLEKSFAYSHDSGFQASPTWLVNNKFKFSGIDAETVKENFCAHNKVAGCDAKLAGPPAPAPVARPSAPAPAPETPHCTVP